MSAVERYAADPSSLPGFLDDLRAEAIAHRPDGGAAGRFVSAEREGWLWLFPVARGGRVAACLAPGEAPVARYGARSEAYWLAHAIRQDLWRALAGRRGPLPVVGVGCAVDGGRRAVLAGALLPRHQRLRAGWQAPALDPARLSRHAAWAARQARQAS